MCPRGAKRRLGLCFLFLLCFLQFQPPAAATLFEKMEVPSEVKTSCHLTNVSQPSTSTLPTLFFCADQCLENAFCTVFCVSGSSAESEGSSCILVNALAVPSGSRTLQQTNNDSCFVPFLPSRPPGVDLARDKAVTVNGKWEDEYADGSTVVSGSRCEATKYDCFCSKLRLTSYFVVDLGTTKPVSTVAVTLSKHFPNYFKDVVIRVGNSGDSSDTYMMKYRGSPQAGEVLLLKGNTTLKGRYVSLYTNGISMCFCLLQVYSE